MKPIDKINLAKSVNFIQSLTPEEKIKYCDDIHILQPHVFFTIIALMQEGISKPMLVHGLNMLMVIHHAFYSNCRSLPLITEYMLRDSLEGNIATLQSIDRGLLTHDDAIISYPEITMLAFIICYMKENRLESICKENNRMMTKVKMVLDTYAKAKSVAANNIGLH